jgi:hypothetical protein
MRAFVSKADVATVVMSHVLNLLLFTMHVTS